MNIKKNLTLYAMSEGVELEEFSGNLSKVAIEDLEVKIQNTEGEQTKSDGNNLNDYVLRKVEENTTQSPKVLACGCVKWIWDLHFLAL
ncbi:MAG: hypothetical protein N3C57_05405 [Aquificaceae bacterium]|nr:hypothetical protein [Aquificaceae bacterium]MCX8076453.1 hypothetical protein [Aquificaceae bacterium]